MAEDRYHYSYTIPIDGKIPPLSVIQEHFKKMAFTDGKTIDYVRKASTPYTVSFVGVCTTL